jgi:low temperature requirement protein LtrA
MLGGLVLSASIPKAFEDRALAFAVAYIFMLVVRDMFMLWALRDHDRTNHLNFLRISIWHVACAPFWLAGALTDGPLRMALWAFAVAVETAAPTVGFWVPALGRSTTADWKIEGAHMAERCGLFIIIALGESVLITGQTFAGLTWNAPAIGGFVVAFLASVGMWLVYFNVGAERSSRLAAASDDPGRIGRNGYTYLHILIVAGIIVAAVGDELVLHHPTGHADAKTAAVVIGGPALYLFGNGWFKWLSAPYFPLSHLIGLGLLALSVPAAIAVPPLLLSALTTAVLIVVVTWEWASLRQRKAGGRAADTRN